jgi:hypothetical protein
MIGDPELKIAKLYDMLPAGSSFKLEIVGMRQPL